MKRIVGVTVVGFILAYWGISLGRSLAPSESSVVSIHNAAEEDIRFTPPPRVPASLPDQGSNSPIAPAVKPVKFEFQAELDSYAILKSIVLPNEEQKAMRTELLTNSRLLKAVALRLTKQPLMDLSDQDVAVDILLDALKDGDSRAAEEALREVVKDEQLEDSTLTSGVREQLAGIKAEVLYQWSAMVPQGANQLASLLPGPVSQRIWQNVLSMQSRNLAESKAEAN